MKMQIAALGCLMLAWNVAIANVDCAKAPYGESVAQYGRDEFQLGIISVTHNDDHPSVPRVVLQRIEKEMRAACLAKFYGRDLPRYAKAGVRRHMLETESVGSIAAAVIKWTRPNDLGRGAVPAPSRTVSFSAPTKRPRVSGNTHNSSSLTDIHYVKVTSDFPACPRRVDLKRLLTAALVDNAAWPQAEAAGKRHGCIELYAGDRVNRVRSDRWSGVIQVRPQGQTRTYWTDAAVIR